MGDKRVRVIAWYLSIPWNEDATFKRLKWVKALKLWTKNNNKNKGSTKKQTNQQKINDTGTKNVHAGLLSLGCLTAFCITAQCFLTFFWTVWTSASLLGFSCGTHRTHTSGTTQLYISTTTRMATFERLFSLFSGWSASLFLSPSFPVETQNVDYKQWHLYDVCQFMVDGNHQHFAIIVCHMWTPHRT